MHRNLEKYLEEIGHFLPDAAERKEILDEIRSHVMEKAADKGEPVTEAALDEAVAAFGRPQQAAERFLESKPIIAPAFRRHLFRYTSLVFLIHLALIALTAVLKRSVSVFFPFMYVPRMNLVEAILYLPMAFLADFGLVALVLFIITRSGREIRLPWPKFAFNLDEVKAPAMKTLGAKIGMAAWSAILLALTAGAVSLFLKYQSLFLVKRNSGPFRPCLQSEPGALLTLAVIIGLASATIVSLIKLFALPRRAAWWVDASADAAALALLGLVLGRPHADLFILSLPEKLQGWGGGSLVVTLLVVALVIGYDLVVNLVRLGRGRLEKQKKTLDLRR